MLDYSKDHFASFCGYLSAGMASGCELLSVRESQHLLDKVFHSTAIDEAGFDSAAVLVGCSWLIDEELKGGFDDGYRGFQLVSGIVDEVLLLLEGPLEPLQGGFESEYEAR
jgi:hypothetical protein